MKDFDWETFFSVTMEIAMIALTAVFAVLKITKVLSFSWVWVFSPIWIPVALLLAFYVLCFIIFGLEYLSFISEANTNK